MSDEDIDRLFTSPPEDFVAARTALVKRLRAAGERAEAKRVAELRRPTVAAWAINQTVRQEPDAYAGLVAAGNALRQALRRAMSGVKDADTLGTARSRRQCVERLTNRALVHLSEAGRDPSAHRADIFATFQAASADEESGERVRSARLSQPLPAPSDFGDLSPLTFAEFPPESSPPQPEPEGAGPAPQKAPAEKKAPDKSREKKKAAEANAAERKKAARAVAQARERAQKASDAVRRVEKKADAAQRKADAAARAADQAEKEAERARRAAERARQEADDERQRARYLDKDVAEARETADRLSGELQAAEQRLAEA